MKAQTHERADGLGRDLDIGLIVVGDGRRPRQLYSSSYQLTVADYQTSALLVHNLFVAWR